MEPINARWHRLKRLIDIAISSLALVLLAPLLSLIAVLIRLDSPGPALYRSRRMTADGRPFVLYKFRTMYEGSPPLHASDGSLIVIADDPRVTRAGRILRLGLDELPQLINVFRGEMSVVGPRADPPEALRSYGSEDWQRLRMKPGITGLAQVSGRTEIPLSRRREIDREYVSHWCPRLDFCVCLLTIFELFPFLGHLLDRHRRRLQGMVADFSGPQSGGSR